MSSWYYVIFSQSPVKEESKKFATYILRPENQARSVVTIPGRKSAAAMPRFQTKDWKPWVEAAPYGEPLPITDKFSQISTSSATRRSRCFPRKPRPSRPPTRRRSRSTTS